MNFRRFFSVFLLTALLLSFLAVPALAADPESKAPEDPEILAKAALLVDRRTGTVMYNKEADTKLPPASLTKIMTCLLALEAVDSGRLKLNQAVTVSDTAWNGLPRDGSTANIKAGEILTVEDLLYCMMVVSANEACNILAEEVDGSVSTFVDHMNQRAQELGCTNTHFANTCGIQDDAHYTTARDLCRITTEALKHEDFMRICDTADVVIPETNLSDARTLHTTNYLLSNWRAVGYRNKEAHGIKTGSTSDAGYCLVSTAERGDLSLISVILGAERVVDPATNRANVRSFSETTRMFDWGFQTFTYQVILTPNDMLASMPVTLSKEVSSVALHCEDEVEVLMPASLSSEDLTRSIRFYSKSVEAPVEQGDRMAEVELSYEGVVYATVPLVAVASVEASRSLVLQQQLIQFFHRTSVRVAGLVILLLIVAAVLWKLTVGRRRYRYGRSVSSRSRGYRGRRR